MAIYNKLVRDKIPEYLESKDISHVIHIAGESEYWQKLKDKLIEEVSEFNKNESIEELADVLEVIDSIKKYKQFAESEILEIKTKKFIDRGGFDKRIILEES